MTFLLIIAKKSLEEIKETNIEAGLMVFCTKESGKYERRSLLNNCITFSSNK
jgi:hypothetical protein